MTEVGVLRTGRYDQAVVRNHASAFSVRKVDENVTRFQIEAGYVTEEDANVAVPLEDPA